MAWKMTLVNKELVGTPPNRHVAIRMDVTNEVDITFTISATFMDANNITLAGMRAWIQNIIDREADLISKFDQLDSYVDVPQAVYP